MIARVIGWLRSDAGRRWLLRVLAAAGVLAVFYGIVSEGELAAWLELAGVLLATSSAAASEPPKLRRRRERGPWDA